MLKTRVFKALALGLLPQAFIGGPADAAGPAPCPAFNAGMIDAGDGFPFAGCSATICGGGD